MNKDEKPFFIHIRHGDFSKEIIQGHNNQLPDSYYNLALSRIKEKYSNPFFIIVGDDPKYAKTLFVDLERKYISCLSVPEDLALMSLCEGGVLSNSTFAWWGAYLGNPGGVYIAPRYWSGWRFRKWLPEWIQSGMISDYIDVPLN
jgi:hypothetical protein